jgi:fucose permease
VPGPGPRWQPTVALAYAAFAQLGLIAGVGGVLLPAQITDYGVSSAAIGVSFFTFVGGFFLASFNAGAALGRFGIRFTLLAGTAATLLAGLAVAARPSFVVFVALRFVIGYGNGLLESALNAHLAALPRATTVLNRLHAFFGLGALVGPVLAVSMLRVVAWPRVWLLLALLCLPLLIGFAIWYPASARPALDVPATDRRGLLVAALRQPAVVLAALFLAVYVGLEQSVGNWSFSLLTGTRGFSPQLAGYAVSGLWLGLTAGRLLVGPIAARTRRTPSELVLACLAGTVATTALVWLVPTTATAICGLVLLGACLGPLFPTTMALTPSMTQARLVPTAIGIANGVSVVGGGLIPWLAGAVAEGLGIWTLLPFCLVASLIALGVWWMVTLRMAPAVADGVGQPAAPETGG